MRLIILFILILASSAFSQIPPIEPGVSQELAKWRVSQYSNISYKLNLTLEKMSPVLRGSMEIHVTQAAYACAEPNCPPMAIILDWRKIPGHENDSTISNVTLNGKAVSIQSEPPAVAGGLTPNTTAAEKLKSPLNHNEPNIYLQPPATAGGSDFNDHLIFRDGVRMGENVIKLNFTSPILTSGSAITRYVDKEDGAEYIYSLFVPSDASTAFPVLDQPDLKARFTLTVNAPPDWKAVSNTEVFYVGHWEVSHGCCGHDEYRFNETKPISPYVFAFAAGPFNVFRECISNAAGSKDAIRCMEIESLGQEIQQTRNWSKIYVRKSQAAKFKPHAAEVFRLNREAVKYLETYFDYKFPFPKYDLVLIPEFPFGGMEHAGATFLREQSVIFPQEPTKNDIVTRANLIFHEAAHQWFGDTVTMKWFDDLWLKEGFATFMAYKALDKIMPEANAWKVFYERVKQAAYRTDSTRGTTAIYQPIANLSAAKSAYGNIVYNKAPAFLRQAEFYLGEDKFQTAVRAFLKKHEFANAGWEDLVTEFQNVSKPDWTEKLSATMKTRIDVAGREVLSEWANRWITSPGLPSVHIFTDKSSPGFQGEGTGHKEIQAVQITPTMTKKAPKQRFRLLALFENGAREVRTVEIMPSASYSDEWLHVNSRVRFAFPNYQDYGYGIFLLDDKSRDYVLKNIQNEKDDFLRTMIWGSLWDSVRESELDPKDYVELVIKNIGPEKDEGTIQTLLSRVTTAMNYYLSEPPAVAGGLTRQTRNLRSNLENLLIDKIQNALTTGQRITYYRAFLNIASTEKARGILKEILGWNAGTPAGKNANQTAGKVPAFLKTKDKFDIVTRLAILGDPDAPKLLAGLEKTETSDDAKRYAYAAHAAFATAENKAKFWNDFINNKDISESWIEDAVETFNSIRHSELTLPYLEKALAELPKLKRDRKIFFVNGWLAEFIGGQRDEKALAIVNKFLANNPSLDKDLRLKILENVDVIERAVKIRGKYIRN